MPLLRLLARFWTVLLGLTSLALFFGLIARFLLPLTPWNEPPRILTITPADSAEEVLPRSEISLHFNAPMNRHTTSAAVRITPPTPGRYHWSDDAQTLTFIPAGTLAPAATYTVTLETNALSRWWQPLATPAQSVFRTAPLPAVVAALPHNQAAQLDNRLVIVFSQVMVPAEQVGQPAPMPQVQIEPPISAGFQWIDQHTLLIQPATPLQAATRYTVTVAPDLTDLRGVDLGTPFRWSFVTAWPTISDRNPPAGERWAGPRQPLMFRLSAPLDPDLLRRSLVIDPAVTGTLDVIPDNAGQVVTFTPENGWTPGRSYTVTLRPPVAGQVPVPPDLRWRFTVEPEPGLVAFFPGQNQLLPPNQPVRLVFSTPMTEDALRAGLSIDPPVADPGITVSGTEVRLRPELAPSSNYTITIAAGTLDRTGEPLDAPVVVRLRTTSAIADLTAPAAFDDLMTIPISRSAAIDLERINLSRLDLSLYKLDPPTLLRTFGFSANEWREFNPERYNRQLARRWQIDLSDPPDVVTRSSFPIGLNDGDPLDPGAYYLRVVSREGPRLDLIVLVSNLRITLRHSDNQALVWATDAASGTPLAAVPLALYAGDALITRGVTGPDGVWEQPIQRNPQDPPYLVLAEGDQPAVADASWSRSTLPEPRHRALLLSDQLSYRAGEAVQIRGQVRRRAAGGDLILPATGTSCRIQLTADRGSAPAAPLSSTCRIATDGELRANLSLSTAILPGNYAVRVQIADITSVLPLRVISPGTDAQLTVARENDTLRVQATSNGQPLADVEVAWSLRLEPIALPAELSDVTFAVPPAPQILAGSERTQADGSLIVVLPPAEPPGLRYRFSAEIHTSNSRNASADAVGLLTPAEPALGVHLPQRVVLIDERPTVELVILGPGGAPERGRTLTVEVFRGTTAAGDPLLVRRTVSDSRGRAAVQLVPLRPGTYTVQASTAATRISTTLYVAGNGYSDWSNQPGEVAVIPDRSAYQPGDVARLLVTSPFTEATVLLTQERDDLRDYTVLPLQAGGLITFTVTPEMAPAISLGALVAADELLVGATELRVGAATTPITVALNSDRATYLPEATAALTVTINDAQGPAAGDILLAISPDDGLTNAADPARSVFAPPAPAGLSVALPGLAPASSRPPQPPTVLPGALVPLAAGAGTLGTVTARMDLPAQPGRWRISAYAFDAGGLKALAATVITTALPLDVEPFAPPSLRPADRAEAGVILRNTTDTTSTVRVAVAAERLLIDGRARLSRSLDLAPGAEERLTWVLSDATGSSAELRITAASGDYRSEQRLPIVIAGTADPQAFTTATLVGVTELRLNELFSDTTQLELRVAPGIRAALTDDFNTNPLTNDNEARAAHVLIAATLGSTGTPAEREAWRDRALQAWNELSAGQNSDGGWGWWPDSPSTPFISAFAVEAQAAGGRFLGPERSPSLRALAYLERVAPQTEPNLRAYIAYVLQQAGRPNISLLRDLPLNELDRSGLAFAALSLNGSEAESAINRLLTLNTPEISPATVPVAAALPHDTLSRTAAMAHALRLRRPNGPVLATAREQLLQSWGVDGWPSSYVAARIAVAMLPERGATQPVIQQISLGNQTIAAAPISATLRLNVPADGDDLLQVQASPAGEVLIAARVPTVAPVTVTPLLVELRDSAGNLLDPNQLRRGQSFNLSLLVIVTNPLLGAELTVALPAGLEVQPDIVQSPFERLAHQADQHLVKLSTAYLMPGVYHIQIPVRAVTIGQFSAPPPRLRSNYADNPAQYARQPLVIEVQP